MSAETMVKTNAAAEIIESEETGRAARKTYIPVLAGIALVAFMADSAQLASMLGTTADLQVVASILSSKIVVPEGFEIFSRIALSVMGFGLVLATAASVWVYRLNKVLPVPMRLIAAVNTVGISMTIASALVHVAGQDATYIQSLPDSAFDPMTFQMFIRGITPVFITVGAVAICVGAVVGVAGIAKGLGVLQILLSSAKWAVIGFLALTLGPIVAFVGLAIVGAILGVIVAIIVTPFLIPIIAAASRWS